MRESTVHLHQKSPREFPPSTVKLLEEIYRVRELELRYEDGAIGETFPVHGCRFHLMP